MTPAQRNQLLDLFSAFSQGTLSEADHSELQGVLSADAEARRLWFLHQDLELGLKCRALADEGMPHPPREEIPVATHSVTVKQGSAIRSPSMIGKSSRSLWRARQFPLLAAVASLYLFVTVIVGVHMWTRLADSDRATGFEFSNHQASSFIVESPTHDIQFAMSDQRGKVIALHFLLKTECPFCLKLIHDYSRIATSNPDVLHLFLKPDSAEEIKVWARQINQDGLKNPPVIYRDPNAQIAKRFGIPDGYRFHGETVHFPALVLLDNSGKEQFRYVGKNNADRMPPDDFIARLAMLTERE